MDTAHSERKAWMGLLARTGNGHVAALLADMTLPDDISVLRPPETGSIMVRGRAGGTGAPFNLGEMTVTRCALRLSCGTVGHGYVQGRCKEDARAAAVVDALMQTDRADEMDAAVLGPLRRQDCARKTQRAQKAAATKVDFFTMVRGED